ncbi:MAG TPA: ABC transporter substrate-binding protein [Actinomycetota bacterium]|nr:ABC transporter substrate-binding protein [Actinomycetota bacterium]
MRHPLRGGLFSLLVVTALLLSACGGGKTGSSAEGGKPIRIGALTSLTGNFTPWGVQVRAGMQLAVDEINKNGGVGGRRLELVVNDDQSKAEEGGRAVERLIERDGVVAVGGIISSDVGLATARVAEQNKVPLFLVKAGAGNILTPNSRYTFRTCLPSAPMVAGPVLQYVQSKGLKRVGAIVADYAWGQAIKAAMESTFAQAPDIKLQVEVAPVGETDFTTYLRSLERFKPQIIVATGHPPGSGAITVQSADLGFKVPVTGAYTPRSLVVGAAKDAAFGRYADFSCADFQSTAYQDLARRYLQRFPDNKFFEDDALAGYGIVTMVAKAVGKVGDDPVAIARYLHENTFDIPGYSFQMRWTEWGELADARIEFDQIGRGPAPEGVNKAGTWYPQRLLVSQPLQPFQPQ